jgi:hypothetical protein
MGERSDMELQEIKMTMSIRELDGCLEDLVQKMVASTGRWILVVDRVAEPLRYVQLLAYEAHIEDDHVAVVEASSGAYDGEELPVSEARALTYLGWPDPEPGANYNMVFDAIDGLAHELACRLLASLQLAFTCRPGDEVEVELIESAMS